MRSRWLPPETAARAPARQHPAVPWVAPLTPGEVAAFLELRTAVAAESSHLETEPGELEEMACSSHLLLEDLRVTSTSAVFVARTTAELVGWVGLYGGQLRRTRHTAELEIGIRRAYRNRGLGRSLLNVGLRHVEMCEELVKVTLRVMETNAAALRLFTRHGFEVEGRARAALRVGDEWVDELILGLFAGAPSVQEGIRSDHTVGVG